MVTAGETTPFAHAPTAKRHGDPVDSLELRRALGSFATGVAVVTARLPDGRRAGITVNSFSSVSLDPPLVLWSLARTSPSIDVFRDATHFGVSVLARDQQTISHRFSRWASDKFAGVALVENEHRIPLIDGALAHFHCRREYLNAGGDHVVIFGRVESFRQWPRDPLVYFRGGYASVHGDAPAPHGIHDGT